MKMRRFQINAVVAGGVLLSSVGVGAAPGDDTAMDDVVSSGDAEISPPADLPELARAARTKLEKIEAKASELQEQKQDANASKDIIKSLCLGDKLGQMDITLSSATDRVAGIEAAAQSGNQKRAVHDSMVLDALVDRAAELGAEANRCIGVEEGSLDGSQLKVSFDPEIPEGNLVSLRGHAAPAANLPSVGPTPPKGLPPGVMGRVLAVPTPSSPTL